MTEIREFNSLLIKLTNQYNDSVNKLVQFSKK